MDKTKPILKTLILGLTSLVAILGLILIPMMTCTKSAKAAGTDSYILLEYIESNGTQYIDTGVIPSTDTKWVHNASLASGGISQVVGIYDNTNGAIRRFDIMSAGTNNAVGVLYNTGTVSGTSVTVTVGEKITNILDVPNSFASTNGSSGTSLTDPTVPFTASIYLFARHNTSSGVSNYAYIKFYSSQIYSNGVLIRDFVPVKRSSDGVLGVLDRVNGVFYTNQGSGTFSAGYLTNDYYISDYLSSNKNAWINTGYVASANSQFSLTAKFNTVTSSEDQEMMGAYETIGGSTYRAYIGRYTGSSMWTGQIYGNSAALVPSGVSVDTNIHTWSLDANTKLSGLDNTSATMTFTAVNFTANLVLFGHYQNGSVINRPNANIYSVQIMTDYILQRNFIPVFDPQTNQAGMWDNVNGTFYTNQDTGSFGYSITGGGTVYSVSTENALNSALTASVAGDIISLSGNIPISSQSITVGYAPVYWGTYTLSSSYHPNSVLYSIEGWYSTQWTTKATNGKLLPSTTYTARFEANVNSASTWGLVITKAVSGDIINLTSGFTYIAPSFTIPANVTVNKNGYTILPPSRSPATQIGYNSNSAAATDTASFTANTTYYAIYNYPTYTCRLIIDPDVSIDISGLAGSTRTEYASYSSIDFSYTYGSEILFPSPYWDQHSFNGWWLNGTDGPYAGISSTDYGNLVFYARWVEAPEIIIGNVNIYRNLINSGDRLIMFTSNIEWQNLPNDNVRTMFMYRLMDADGTSVLSMTQPYYAYLGGYYLQAVGFYFPDDSVIEWGGEYQIRIDGNPSQWYSISDVQEVYNISSLEYTESSDRTANQAELAAWLINVSQLLENDWLNYLSMAPLITTNSSGNQVLTKTGQAYYLNTVPNINQMAPSLFDSSEEIIPITPDNPMPDVTGTPTLIERWENQYEGTWVQDSFSALGDLFHVNWRTITSVLCLILWVIFAAISQMKWGTTDAGLWMGAVMFGVMVTMGLMNWAVVITAAVLMALYSLYIVFWRQG